MKITIIIPVYNALLYLNNTLDSVISQANKELEIIIINDGSTDGSDEICEKYLQNDVRIKLFHKENGGLSSARNYGIKNATGEYIWFVDADDLIFCNIVNDIVDYLEKCKIKPDILFSNSQMFSILGIDETEYYNYNIEYIKKCDINMILSYLWGNLDISFAVWRHLYRTEFIHENNICFNNDIQAFESVDWMLNTILKAQHFNAHLNCIYKYRIDNCSSITHQMIQYKHFMYAYEVTVRWFRYFQCSNYEAQAKRRMLLKFSEIYTYISSWIPRLPSKDKRKALELYQNNIDIMDFKQYQYDRKIKC